MRLLRVRRRWVIISACGVMLVFAVLLFGPNLARPLVRAKLQEMVRDQLNAELELGSLNYLPFYGVSVEDARLVAQDSDGKPVNLFSAKRLAISLAKLPLWGGPLVIRSVEIESPSVHVINTPQGLVGKGLTIKPDQSAPVRQQKLSEMFELRRLALTGGSIVYEDRTVTGSVPLAWRGLHVDLKTGSKSAAEYAYDLNVGDGKAASITSGGTVDIDELLLRIEKCVIQVQVDPQAPDSPIPADLQLLLKQYQINGAVAIDLHGEFPMHDPSAASLESTVELLRAAGKLPDADAPLDEVALKVNCSTEPAPSPPGAQGPGNPIIKANIERLSARSRDTLVRIDGGVIVLNSASAAWGINDLKLTVNPGADRSGLPRDIVALLDRVKLSGAVNLTLTGSGPIDLRADTLDQVSAELQIAPADVSMHPPELPLSLHDFGDLTVRLADAVATVETLRAGYGDDVLYLKKVSLPLKDFPKSIRADDIDGCVTFGRRTKQYPAPLDESFARADPRGPFWFTGRVSGQWSGEQLDNLDYQIRLTTDRGEVSTLQRHIPLYNINADVLATPAGIKVYRFDADALSGKVSVNGKIDLDGDLPAYAAQVRLRRIDLNSAAQFAVKPGEKPITVAGELSADIDFSGRGLELPAVLDTIHANGAVQIARGELFHVPVFDKIAGVVGIKDAGTVGDAGCSFAIGDRKVQVTNLAVGAPAIGIHGKGEVSLDGALNLEVVATPLSDWEKGLRRDDNAVANVAATIAGTVQKGMNKVTADYLCRLRVHGMVGKPEVDVIAAPALQRK